MMMVRTNFRVTCAAFAAISAAAVATTGAQSPGTAAAHRAAAKAAAGQEHLALLARICPEPSGAPAPAPEGGRGSAPPAAQPPRSSPPRSEWHVEPVKVFDNLYFVGQSEYSAWAVNTSDGIIVIDTIFDYSVEDEVVNGLKKLGLDPARIKYAIVSHGHGDHSGGAKYLQDRFGTRIILSAADWDLLERSSGGGLAQPVPRRDMVATDGQKLTLGDTTLTLYLTPGHTAGTISTLIPVKDNGRSHLMAYWGGTAFNFAPKAETYKIYSESAQRFRDIVRKAGADGILSNHTNYDGSKTRLPMMATRKPTDPHPYVVGTDVVTRYLTVADECAKAALLEMR
jgi:metallo-beta-lactamase class B